MNNVYQNKLSVQRMVLFFKIDYKKKLRLLYCTNFKASEIKDKNDKSRSGIYSKIKTLTKVS